MMETGTLKELNVKPGDVVEHIAFDDGRTGSYKAHFKIDNNGDAVEIGNKRSWFRSNSTSTFRIASRAPDTPRTWCPDEGWGEWTGASEWSVADHDVQFECVDGIHRVRTRPRVCPEPKRRTVTLHGEKNRMWWGFSGDEAGDATHRLTFDTIDGEPVCDSIKMERI